MLHIKDLQVGYGHCVVAQCDETIAMGKAKFIALIGPNGSGKSTLLRAMNDGSHIINGTVTLNDQLITDVDPVAKSKSIALVLTDRHFSYFLKVQEMLALSRSPYSNYLGKLTADDHAFIDQIVDLIGIDSLRNKRLSTLSDGQLQAVIIARALVQDTAYILMDEPTSHLDINHRAEILMALRNYCHDTGKTIIYSTHELQIGLELCDEVLYIHNRSICLESRKEFMDSNQLPEMFPSPLLRYTDGGLRIRTDHK